MSISAQWDTDQREIMIVTFDGKWTWQEFHETVDYLKRCSAEIDHSYYIIADVTTSQVVSSNAFVNIKSRHTNTSPNYVATVLIGANRYVEMLFTVAERVYPKLFNGVYSVAPTLDAARDKIAAMREVAVV